MTMEDYKALEAARDEAQKRCNELEKALVEAKLSSGESSTVRDLTTLSRSLLTIARFAVGQLPPETTQRWPWRNLRTIATLLPTLPDFNLQDDHAIKSEFEAFASEVERCEQIRADNLVVNRILEGKELDRKEPLTAPGSIK